MANRLILFRGKPGSGKTQAAYRMFPGTFHLENDMYHIHDGKYEWSKDNMPKAVAWCIDMCKTALSNKFDVVICNTFTKMRFIEAYKRIAEKFGAEFYVYRCSGNFQNVHGLSPSIVDSFERAMEDWPGEILVEQT